MNGLFDKTLEVQEPSTGARDSTGGLLIGYSTVAEVRAKVDPAGANDLMRAGKDSAEVSHVVFCDVSDYIDVNCRFYDPDKEVYYKILAPQHPSYSRFHKWLCRRFIPSE